MVDQEIRVLGDENIIANPKNSQKQYPLTFKAVPNVIVYGRKKADLNFTVPIPEGVNFNFNLDRTSIIFADNFNLEEYSYIMVKNPFEEIQDFFYVSSLEELDPTGKEFNEFNDEVVKWLRRLVNIISNRCMIFETTLFKDLNNFPNIKSGQTFIRTDDGWTGITIKDINSELDLIFNKYVEEVNKKIQEHQTQMNELLAQWKQDIQKYTENVKQYEIVRVVTQSGHGFVFEPVMYSISQRKFVKAVFPHGADGVAVRVDDNNFRLVWAGRVEIPATAKDTQQRDFVLGEYYFLGEGSNGGTQREKPDTYYQHLFQVMYSDELQQNIADVLLSVPINQKGKRWDVGEAKTTVNDIEELKMSDFPVGKVIEVLGYYKAGDGADHKRIISFTDDGSGVQLNNNLWANIVHNGEVNVSWFGATHNFIDSSNYIQQAINFCEKNSIVLRISGKFKTDSTLILKTVKIVGNGANANFVIPTTKRNGYLGWKYLTNYQEGATVTSEEVYNELITGDCIYSDKATVFITENTFNLNGIGIFGYLRTKGITGIKQVDSEKNYISGNHIFNDVIVSGFDSNGIELLSLEVTTINKLKCIANNGNGLKITNIESKDTPVEYIIFKECTFSNNRLWGVNIDRARKKIKFTSDCIFIGNGQYNMKPLSDNIEFDRSLPINYDDVVGGILISSMQETSSSSRKGGYNIEISSYAEECNKLFHIKSEFIFNNSSFSNIIMFTYAGEYKHSDSKVGVIECTYINNLKIKNNYVEGGLQTVDVRCNNINGFIETSQNEILTKVNLKDNYSAEANIRDLRNGFFNLYDNFSESPYVYNCTIFKDIYHNTGPDIGVHPPVLVFLVSTIFRANLSSYQTQDIVSFFKNSRGDYVLYKLTNNGLEINSNGDGIVQITVPKNSVLGIQRLDMTQHYNKQANI